MYGLHDTPEKMTDGSLRLADLNSPVLEEALPLIHSALVNSYEFMPEDAEAFEEILRRWFLRLARRSGIPRSATDLRQQLLFVACKYARAFQLARSRGLPRSEKLTTALTKPPEEMAITLLNQLRTRQS